MTSITKIALQTAIAVPAALIEKFQSKFNRLMVLYFFYAGILSAAKIPDFDSNSLKVFESVMCIYEETCVILSIFHAFCTIKIGSAKRDNSNGMSMDNIPSEDVVELLRKTDKDGSISAALISGDLSCIKDCSSEIRIFFCGSTHYHYMQMKDAMDRILNILKMEIEAARSKAKNSGCEDPLKDHGDLWASC